MAEINPRIEEVLRRVGCREGIAWVQLMLDEDDHFYIIEMGYRLPGDVTDAAYPALCSFDSIRWLTDFARGIRHTAADLPPAQEHAYRLCTCGYSLWTRKSGVIREMKGFDKICCIPGVRFYTLYHAGESFPAHMPLGVVSVVAEDCEDFCRKLKEINETISITDESGEDVIIRYTDFDSLRKTYEAAQWTED